MTMTGIKRDARPVYREAGIHIFAVGQSVRLKGGFRQPAQLPGVFRVTALLPATGDMPQYRIRNDDERHERVTTQDNLEPIRKSTATENASLAEQTFGPGQETPASPPRSPRLRTGKHA